ncbi:MAG TPA: hypothetical protein VF600_14955 [Abditibacteriaceae bacterium]|jgi:hypothetical protein
MKLNKLIVLPVLTAAFALAVAAPKANAATDSTTVNLTINDYVAVDATTSITVTPTLSQIDGGSVTTADNPITLTIDSSHGAEVTIEGSGGSLADEDLELNAGQGWVGAEDSATALYTSSVAQDGVAVPVNVRITNLGSYDVGSYSNTVTFTVTAADGGID